MSGSIPSIGLKLFHQGFHPQVYSLKTAFLLQNQLLYVQSIISVPPWQEILQCDCVSSFILGKVIDCIIQSFKRLLWCKKNKIGHLTFFCSCFQVLSKNDNCIRTLHFSSKPSCGNVSPRAILHQPFLNQFPKKLRPTNLQDWLICNFQNYDFFFTHWCYFQSFETIGIDVFRNSVFEKLVMSLEAWLSHYFISSSRSFSSFSNSFKNFWYL